MEPVEHIEDKGPSQGSRKPLLDHFDASIPVPAGRSRIMSRIRGKDTKQELELRRAIHGAGLRFRVHDRSLPGTPDISNKSRKVAVFVDGCFWHGCPDHFRAPKTRSEFWVEKIRRNRDKRMEVLAAYGAGWKVLQLYECEIKTGEGPDQIINAWG